MSAGAATPHGELAGKTVLVTGASRGVGRAIVERLATTGASVVAHYARGRDGAAEATRDFAPGTAHLVGADLGLPDGAASLWRQVEEVAPRVDAVVLNAGIMPKVEADADDEEWDSVIRTALQVNTLSQAELARRAVSHFRGHGSGVLVGISSWVSQRGAGHPNLAAYAASKAATGALLKTFARAYAAEGLLTYLVAPGAIDTQMTHDSAADRGGLEAITSTLAMGELVPPTELAELVTVLCTGRLRHLTGATLDVNGASYVR
ncbi:SDR family NAD(P)-dependent oxidoreductase [Nocardioides flavescens]|uniref:SDR family oxidoreductase n=1 Tax=Nocardioides flavescens TaxID=2691959 RepID=A0A6L7F2B0_9ACTN|nr:SDR family oxidoreductase [Nocardioides flavescens]MXG91341.1 SDR family oxidoreductase [Nocardioides flavescens]